MRNSKASTEKLLTHAQVAITNTLTDPILQGALTTFGYDAERLQEGNQLRENLRTLYQQQSGAYGDLFAAKDELAATQKHAHATYMDYVIVARIAFRRDRGTLQKLALTGSRKQSRAGWLAQAQQFYSNALANPTILEKLAKYGITVAVLEAGKSQVDEVASHNVDQKQYKGDAQGATKLRADAMAALEEWMRDFLRVARVALRDRPQFLPKLGLAMAPSRSSAHSASASTSTTTSSSSSNGKAAPVAEVVPVVDTAAPVTAS